MNGVVARIAMVKQMMRSLRDTQFPGETARPEELEPLGEECLEGFERNKLSWATVARCAII